MTFKTIIADPPWQYDAPGQFGCTLEHRPNRDKTKNRLGSGSKSRYGSMSLGEIKELPVRELVSSDAHLYLWTTNSMLVEAHEVARAWGFDPKTVITWVKVRHSDGEPSMKMGYYYRSATEHCLFAVKGRLRLHGPARPTAFFHPRLEHSRKPPTIHEWAEEQSPGPYLELFARQDRDGWVCLGSELDSWPW